MITGWADADLPPEYTTGGHLVDWPLSHSEKKSRLLRLYDTDLQVADQLLRSGQARVHALRGLQHELERLSAARAEAGALAEGESRGSAGSQGAGEAAGELQEAIRSTTAALEELLGGPQAARALSEGPGGGRRRARRRVSFADEQGARAACGSPVREPEPSPELAPGEGAGPWPELWLPPLPALGAPEEPQTPPRACPGRPRPRCFSIATPQARATELGLPLRSASPGARAGGPAALAAWSCAELGLLSPIARGAGAGGGGALWDGAALVDLGDGGIVQVGTSACPMGRGKVLPSIQHVSQGRARASSRTLLPDSAPLRTVKKLKRPVKGSIDPPPRPPPAAPGGVMDFI